MKEQKLMQIVACADGTFLDAGSKAVVDFAALARERWLVTSMVTQAPGHIALLLEREKQQGAFGSGPLPF